MVYAYVLVTVAIGKMNTVISDLNKFENIVKLDTVTGPCDIIVKLNVKDYHELKEIVINRIRNIDGVVGCCTSLVVGL